MQLPSAIHKRLAEEFRFAADRMREAPDLPSKLYLFSAFYGETNRMLNQWWSPDLALLHMVLQDAYRVINGRTTETMTGVDRVIGIPKELPEALTQIADDLAGLFQRKTLGETALHNILTRLAELTYVTTGNGRYLLLKGIIKL